MTERFTIRGKEILLSKADITAAAKGISPKRVQKYSALIGGKRYPIKQLVSAATRVPEIGMTSQDAYRILRKLDVDVQVEG